jgi:PAS domain S-box-containing protein
MSFEPKVNVLLVDDHPENLLALEAILDSLGQNLVRATSGAEALRRLLNQDFAVILLDVQMPDMDGFETATLIRQRERSRHTPIIFLTAFSTSDNMVYKGYSLGAVDYLFKPIEPEILKSKVAAFVDLSQKTAEVKQQAIQLQAMNAELKKREEMFRSLSACSPVGIFLTDTIGKCTYTNPRFQAICGLSPQESLGEGWTQTIHPKDREKAITNWYEAFNQGIEYKGEFRLLIPEGIERWVCMSSAAMLTELGEVIGYVGTLEDITERKKAEQEHVKLVREQTARQEAETANRLKDEFLATLSHELRTPLTSILGWARLLRQRKLDEEAINRALETIERNASLQAQLINDILDVSRIIRGKLELNLCPVNLASIVSTSVDSIRLEAEAKNLQLEYVIQSADTEDKGANWAEEAETRTQQNNISPLSTSPFLVLGDQNRLQQILWNLLNNAIKFTPDGGKIEVRLSIEESQENTPNTRVAVIRVTDTGTGISPDFLPHVFDRFRQADGSITRPKGGLGLGLAIVRYLVEMHRGNVCAQSLGVGHGATFTVKLPVVELGEKKRVNTSNGAVQNLAMPELKNPEKLSCVPLLPTSLPNSSFFTPMCLKGLQVLVVDDDTDTLEYITTVLQESGATVTAVTSARVALSAIEQLQPDILVSDIGMPEEDGYSLIRKIRNLKPDKGGQTPAIALTAYVRQQDSQQAFESGYHMFVSKPVEPAQLITSVIKLVQSNCKAPSL